MSHSLALLSHCRRDYLKLYGGLTSIQSVRCSLRLVIAKEINYQIL